MTTTEMLKALAVRFPPPAWAFLPQVRSQTGYVSRSNGGSIRTADAIAMGLWPSRGLEIIGFELKASRSDWQRELINPAKAEEIYQFCDRWYVVAGDKDIVRLGELPPTWGLIIPRGTSIVIQTEALKLSALPFDRPFLAAVLRKTQETHFPMDQLDDRLKAEYEKGKKEGAGSRDRLQDEHDELKKAVDRFEKESGVWIRDRWRWGNVGRAVQDVITRGPEAIRKELESHRNWAKQIIEDIDRQLAEPEKATDA